MKPLPYSAAGVVVKGAGLGRRLGFPTANVRLPEDELPERGVYKVSVRLEERALPAVCNVGVRPTVDGKSGVHVEVHIPGFSGDLYGQTLRLTFLAKLRDERKFPDLAALKAQIQADLSSL